MCVAAAAAAVTGAFAQTPMVQRFTPSFFFGPFTARRLRLRRQAVVLVGATILWWYLNGSLLCTCPL